MLSNAKRTIRYLYPGEKFLSNEMAIMANLYTELDSYGAKHTEKQPSLGLSNYYPDCSNQSLLLTLNTECVKKISML